MVVWVDVDVFLLDVSVDPRVTVVWVDGKVSTFVELVDPLCTVILLNEDVFIVNELVDLKDVFVKELFVGCFCSVVFGVDSDGFRINNSSVLKWIHNVISLGQYQYKVSISKMKLVRRGILFTSVTITFLCRRYKMSWVLRRRFWKWGWRTGKAHCSINFCTFSFIRLWSQLALSRAENGCLCAWIIGSW